MKQGLLFILSLFIGLANIKAQENKAKLKEACAIFSKSIGSTSNFYMSYTVTITGNNANTGTSVKHTEVFKTHNAYKMLIDKDQEVLYTPGRMLMLNNTYKIAQYSEDTTTSINTLMNMLFASFTTLLDSAQNVTYKKNKGTNVYEMSFGAKYAYQSAIFTFNSDGVPVSMYCVFNQNIQAQVYQTLSVNYTNWKYDFAPEQGFPGIDKYITKTDKGYQLVPAKKDFKFFQNLNPQAK